MAGYERQSSAEIIPGATVRAAPINAEYNQLDAAFAALTGHKHDGTTGEGGYIPLIADADAKNKVVVDTGTNTVTFFTEVGGVAVAQVVFKDGSFVPATDNDIDLGSVTAYFKNAYIKGNMQVAAVTSSGNISPATTATYDLGSPTFQWRDVHVSGTVDTTAVVADTVKLNGGTGGTTGTLSWNAEDATADLVLENGTVLQLGQEEHLHATNTSGGTIVDGQVVRITGSSGSKVTVGLANASSEATSQGTIAVATSVVANNSAGYFTTQGMVRNIDTSAFAEGAPLYLSTTNGGITTTRPVSPNHLVIIGWCVRSHATVGSIFVKVSNGWELEELHDVKITSVADKDFLRWNSTVGVWENTKDATFTSGSINNVTVGATTPTTGKFTTLTATGNFSVEGNTTIGNATSDTINFTARANTDFLPSVDGTYSLGSTTQEWQNLWIDGTANIDSLVADTADIDGGTIDGASVGATTPLTYARVDQLALDNATISATGVATNIDITLTPKGTGLVFLPKVDINAGNIDGTVIGAAAPTAITGSTITANTGFSGNITSTGTSSFSTISVSTAATVPTPTADAHASTKKYVDDQITALVGTASTTLDTLGEIQDWLTNNNGFTDLTDAINSRLSTTGGTLTGQLAMSNNKITGLGYPSVATDAASKAYVDDALDPFQDQYLGAKATDPTVDNDGDPLLTGALYFDSTNGVMKVFNGTEWQAASSSIEGIKDSFYYTATQGQTLFVGSDDNLNLMVLDKADLASVYLNGVRLLQGTDYTISVAGDSITLAAGAAAGDLIEVEVFGNFAGQAGSEVSITGGTVANVTLNNANVASGDLTFGQNVKSTYGITGQLEIYQDAFHGYVAESGQGNLNLSVDTGAVNLNMGGTTRLATTTTGINVTGTTDTDSITLPNGWTVTESGGALYFKVSGVNKMKLASDGTLQVAGDVEANATIS